MPNGKKELKPVKRVNQGPDKVFDGKLAGIAKNLINTGVNIGKASSASPSVADKIGGQVAKSFKMYDNNPKISTIAGQSIHESGHAIYDIENGPQKGDLIRGEHMQHDKDGYVMDLDYKVELEKDTSDASGPYKIWKTLGTK